MPLTSKNLILITLVFSVFWIYYPGLYGPFIFDDLTNITNNSLLRLNELTFSSLYEASKAGFAGPLKRPIAISTFALNYYVAGGYDAVHFKVTNIAIHSINAVLVFLLSLKLIKLARQDASPQILLALAASVAFIWALHPINLTSVLYIVQRMTSLSTLFTLLCLLFYLSARGASSGQNGIKSPIYYIAASVSFILAIYSKENALLTPLYILLIEAIFFSKQPPWSVFNALSSRIKILSTIILVALFVAVAWHAFDYAARGFGSRPFTMWERVLTESRVVVFYLSLILIPRINGFGLFHDDFALSTSFIEPITTLISFIVIAGLIITAFAVRKKQPLFALGIGLFFIGHLMESTIFPLDIAYEHRNNFPSIGIILALVSLPPRTINTKKFIASISAICLIVGGTTALRAKQWGNYQSLAFFEAQHHPNSPAIQALLSNAANQAGDIELATSAIKKAMDLDPTETAYALHYQNILAVGEKPIPQAIQDATIERIKANRISPSTQLALDQIAGCLKLAPCKPLRQNYIGWISAVIEKQPKKAVFWYMRGKAQLASGNTLAALNDYQHAFDLSPLFLHPLFEIANILMLNNQWQPIPMLIEQIETANEKSRFKRYDEIEQLKTVYQHYLKNTQHSSRLK